MTEKRLKKFLEVVKKRQKYLTVVLENVHDPHNVSAVLRSAESVGIDYIYLIYNVDKFPKISRVSSASANKWVTIHKFRTVRGCFSELKKNKFRILSTHLASEGKNKSLFELDLTKKVALVFGNEHRGVSDEVKQLSDDNFVIPMAGMVQSLNISVSVAVCLYEAMRQRIQKGMYEKSVYTKKEINDKLNNYLQK